LTPPTSETDVLIDTDEVITSYLYDSEPISELHLPPIFYAKRGDGKRIKIDSISSTSSPSNYFYYLYFMDYTQLDLCLDLTNNCKIFS